MTRRITALLVLAVLAVGLTTVRASAQPGTTERITLGPVGVQSNADSNEAPSFNTDGRFVAFSSSASNLVGGDTNSRIDVFVRDRRDGTTERVSVPHGGGQANGDSGRPVVSADGRFVAFHSSASNLVANDTNNVSDVFVHDRQTGDTERISVATGGGQATARSIHPSISGDGRIVAFTSMANDLAAEPGTCCDDDVFVHDRVSGVTSRVTVSGGVDGAISADGRIVAYVGGCGELVGCTGTGQQIFERDLQTGVTSQITQSRSAAGAKFNPALSGDGGVVAFVAAAEDLVPGDVNGFPDVFVAVRQTGTIALASVDSAGRQGNAASSDTTGAGPAISADGRLVAFVSSATDLVTGDTNGVADVFVHDRISGETTRENVASDGSQAVGFSSTGAAISPDGRWVGFASNAPNLVPSDTNGRRDIFAHALPGASTTPSTSTTSLTTSSTTTSTTSTTSSTTTSSTTTSSTTTPSSTTSSTRATTTTSTRASTTTTRATTTTTTRPTSTTSTRASTTTSTRASTTTSTRASTTTTTRPRPTTTTRPRPTTTSRPPVGPPDLTVDQFSGVPATAAAGGGFTVHDTVKNHGPGLAPSSVTSYFLLPGDWSAYGRDGVKQTGERLDGERPVGPILPRQSSDGFQDVTIPATVAPAAYRVFACADGRDQVREVRDADSDNCIGSADLLFVRAPALPGPVPPVGPPESPPPCAAGSEVGRLVASAVNSPDLPAALSTTAAVLTRAGIAVDDGGAPPRSGIVVSQAQLVSIARDARVRAHGGRMTLADLAVNLDGLGVPAASGPHDRNLKLMLQSIVTTAAAAPDEPASAAPLLLAALASCQDPPVDLAKGDYLAGDYRLTFLDIELLAATVAGLAPAFRGNEPAPGAPTAVLAASSSAVDGFAPVGPASVQAAVGVTNCSSVKEILEDQIRFAGSVWGYAAGQTATAALQKYVESFAFYLDAANPLAAGAAFSKLLSAAGLVMKIQGLVELYDTATASVQVSDDRKHKPDVDHPAEGLVAFNVVAGVADDEWAAYQAAARTGPDFQLLRDCAKTLGFPVPTNLADIGASVTDWKVQWRIVEGGAHGQVSLDNNDEELRTNGQLETRLLARDDHSGQRSLVVDLKPEKASDHPGRLVTSPLTVRAAVRTSPPPDIGTLFSTLEGGAGNPFGVPSAIGDVLVGMFQDLKTIDAYKTMQVEYHERIPATWSGQTVSVESGVADCYPGTPPAGVSVSCRADLALRNEGVVVDQTSDYLVGDRHYWNLSLKVRTSGRVSFERDAFGVETGYICTSTLETHRSGEIEGGDEQMVNATVVVYADGRWGISFTMPREVRGFGTYKETGSADATGKNCVVLGAGKPHLDINSESEVNDSIRSHAYGVSFSGRIDPAKPGDTLQGSLSTTGAAIAPFGVGEIQTEQLSRVALSFPGGIPIPGR